MKNSFGITQVITPFIRIDQITGIRCRCYLGHAETSYVFPVSSYMRSSLVPEYRPVNTRIIQTGFISIRFIYFVVRLGTPDSFRISLLIILITNLEQIPIDIPFNRITGRCISMIRSLVGNRRGIIELRIFIFACPKTFGHKTVGPGIDNIVGIRNSLIIRSRSISPF